MAFFSLRTRRGTRSVQLHPPCPVCSSSYLFLIEKSRRRTERAGPRGLTDRVDCGRTVHIVHEVHGVAAVEHADSCAFGPVLCCNRDVRICCKWTKQ